MLLCGHSLGGALALRLALDAPERLAGLVVINSSSAAGSPQWRETARAGMLEMASRVRLEGTGFLKKTRLYPAHSRRLDPISKDLLTRDFDRIQAAGLAGTAESLVVEVNAYERHGELEVPMLLVVGDRDADFAPNADAFASRFPAGLVRVVHLPEAGHAANIEQPREFEAAVTGFARRLGYLPAAVTRRTGTGATRLMTTLGGVLVVAGLGLLAAAIFVNGGGGDNGGDSPVLAAPGPSEDTPAAATPTPEQATAGTRTAGPLSAGGNVSTTPSVEASPTVSTTTAAAATATTRPPAATPTSRPAARLRPRTRRRPSQPPPQPRKPPRRQRRHPPAPTPPSTAHPPPKWAKWPSSRMHRHPSPRLGS